jgi:hypothetical protein
MKKRGRSPNSLSARSSRRAWTRSLAAAQLSAVIISDLSIIFCRAGEIDSVSLIAAPILLGASVLAALVEELSKRLEPGLAVGPIEPDGSISRLAKELADDLFHRAWS